MLGQVGLGLAYLVLPVTSLPSPPPSSPPLPPLLPPFPLFPSPPFPFFLFSFQKEKSILSIYQNICRMLKELTELREASCSVRKNGDQRGSGNTNNCPVSRSLPEDEPHPHRLPHGSCYVLIWLGHSTLVFGQTLF